MSVLGRMSIVRILGCALLMGWLAVGSVGLQACGGNGETPKGGCTSNDDCSKEETNKICDKNVEKCVQCVKSSDCGKNEICNPKDNTCLAGCSTDADCANAFPDRKDAKVECSSQKCVIKCDTKADCAVDERCSENQCIKNTCTEDKDCGKGEKCDSGKCIPAKKLSGKYENCESVDDCEEGLVCATYKGGTANLCWKPCDKGCDKDTEVCVKADQFAEGFDVCMKSVKTEGAYYDFDSGTACATGLISITQGGVNFGSCWKDCETKCLGDNKCLLHPGLPEDNKQKFCFIPCKADSDCPTDVRCKEHTKANNEFYCIP
jgi:hypothetical protein